VATTGFVLRLNRVSRSAVGLIVEINAATAANASITVRATDQVGIERFITIGS